MRKSLFVFLVGLIVLVLAPFASAQVINSRHIGQSLVFYHTHQKRLIHAVGPSSVVFNEDFVRFVDAGATADPVGWITTVVEVGAGATEFDSLDGSGGFGRITAAANEDDGGNYQVRGEAFEFTSDQVVYFGVFGLQLVDVTQSDFFLGFSITDTTILGGATDSIGFRKVDATADLTFVVEKDSTETIVTGLATLVDATAVDLEFYFDGTNVEVFVNGASVATPAVTNLPDNEALSISWAFLTGEAVANTTEADRITAIQVGR